MNGAALILYVVFAIVAFGWRTWVHWRRTGDSGLRLHAQPGTIQWWSKLAFIAALAAGFAAPIAGLAGLDPIGLFDTRFVHVVGVIAAVVGIAATLAAQWQMGTSWRIGVDPSERTDLVSRGVFAYIRNPIFSAMTITAFGLSAMVGNVVALIGFVALVVALQVQVRFVEEPYMRAVHGEGYDSYAGRAGRFVPGVGRLRTRVASEASG
jgi:protein-S-isoprenylcysteine O-methyltransferase Ste14